MTPFERKLSAIFAAWARSASAGGVAASLATSASTSASISSSEAPGRATIGRLAVCAA